MFKWLHQVSQEKLPYSISIKTLDESKNYWEFEWKDLKLSRADKLYIKYRVDVNGDDKVTIPQNVKGNKWLEQWL